MVGRDEHVSDEAGDAVGSRTQTGKTFTATGKQGCAVIDVVPRRSSDAISC
jgi:hypothetical protein